MVIAVSACLLGENCKYNGGNNRSEELIRRLAGHRIVPVCPEREVFPVPRPKIERLGARVVNEFGEDVTDLCRLGVLRTVEALKGEAIELAILKSRSPTCGVNGIYDGSFSGRLILGMGLLAQELAANGIPVRDVEDVLCEGSERFLP